jgi:hypothetical protein
VASITLWGPGLWTIQLRAMVEAFLANAPDEMPPPRLLTILRHYYGLYDAATTESAAADKLMDGRGLHSSTFQLNLSRF